jgi:hypothetical protein
LGTERALVGEENQRPIAGKIMAAIAADGVEESLAGLFVIVAASNSDRSHLCQRGALSLD